MNAIDTNIWIYCYDSRDQIKQQIAKELVSSVDPLVLLWQVGCEFIAVARKLEPFGFTSALAWEALSKIEEMADLVFFPEREVWSLAQGLQQDHRLQFWESLADRSMYPQRGGHVVFKRHSAWQIDRVCKDY